MMADSSVRPVQGPRISVSCPPSTYKERVYEQITNQYDLYNTRPSLLAPCATRCTLPTAGCRHAQLLALLHEGQGSVVVSHLQVHNIASVVRYSKTWNGEYQQPCTCVWRACFRSAMHPSDLPLTLGSSRPIFVFGLNTSSPSASGASSASCRSTSRLPGFWQGYGVEFTELIQDCNSLLHAAAAMHFNDLLC